MKHSRFRSARLIPCMTSAGRQFMFTLCSAALALPTPTRAQQTDRMWRIGALMGYAECDPEARTHVIAESSHARDKGQLH